MGGRGPYDERHGQAAGCRGVRLLPVARGSAHRPLLRQIDGWPGRRGTAARDALDFDTAGRDARGCRGGATVDPGAGLRTGALSVNLLERGASRVTGVDLSPASIEAARRRAAERGVADRAVFVVGDGALAPLELHDWVVLDRVLCCYGDLGRLMDKSIAAAAVRYAFSVPLSSGVRGIVNRLLRAAENATNVLRGRPCPGYGHDVRKIEDRLRRAGFARVGAVTAGLWYLAIFERPSTGS